MNHAMQMHPCWGATEGPGMRRNSMQDWQPEPPNRGFDGPRGGPMAGEAFGPTMGGPQGSDGKRRSGGGKRRHRGQHSGGPRMDWIEDPMGPMSGPGGPFRGQRGRRGRRNRGDVRASVLLLLDEQPRHGYEILTELADRSDGAWRPSPGSIYPVLKTLSEEGLVHPEQEAGRRVFHLTDTGRRFVNEHRESWGEPWKTESLATSPGLDDLHQEARQLFGAVRQVVEGGDEGRIRQTAATLARARKDIYLMLADVDVSDSITKAPEGDDSPSEGKSPKGSLGEETPPEEVEAPEAAGYVES